MFFDCRTSHSPCIARRGCRVRNTLQAGSGPGHLQIGKFLLESGADPNAQGKDIFNHSNDIILKGGRYGMALQAASDSRHLDIRVALFETFFAPFVAPFSIFGRKCNGVSYKI